MTRMSFRDLPGMSALFIDYVSDWSKVRQFYRHPYTIDSIVNFGRRRLERGLPHREVLCRALADQQRTYGGSTASVDKLAAGAVAIVTGQQPGLFTGPLYSILKAITVIKLARAVTDAGLPAVPVFWAAAEDHDHEEIQWAAVLDKESALRKLRVDLSNDDTAPVGRLQFREDVAAAAAECLRTLPQSEFQADLKDILENSYRPGLSPVEAFSRMMVRLFGDWGLILADPLDPALKAVAQPVLAEVVRRNGEIRNAVLARSRAISEAGYHEQVKVDSGFTGLFAYRGKSRLPMRPDDLTADVPLSPNVLVRPVIQDTIFPTAAFVTGPAETAYLAQAGAVYETLGMDVTPFFPRISATLLEHRVARPLKKYELQFGDVFHGREFLKRRAVESVQGVDGFAKVKKQVSESIESLRSTLNAVDPTLLGALDTARQKMVYQVETLETKFVNAEARRNEVLEKQLELVCNSLFPEKKLQERMLNVTSFIARYGRGFLDRLEQAVSLETTKHQVIEI